MLLPIRHFYFFPRETERRVLPIGGSVSLFSFSHLHICSFSYLLILTSSHFHILTCSHSHIFTSSLFVFLPSCPSCHLLLSYFSSEGKGRDSANKTAQNVTFSHETTSDRQKNWGKNAISRCPPQPFRTKRGSIVKKLRQKCNFNLSGVTLSHVTRFDRQKLNCLLFAGSRCNPLARNEGRSPKAEWKLRFFLCVENFWMLCAKFSVCKSICVKAPV